MGFGSVGVIKVIIGFCIDMCCKYGIVQYNWVVYFEVLVSVGECFGGVLIENCEVIDVIQVYDGYDILFFVDLFYVYVVWYMCNKGGYWFEMDDVVYCWLIELFCVVDGMVVFCGYVMEFYDCELCGWV